MNMHWDWHVDTRADDRVNVSVESMTVKQCLTALPKSNTIRHCVVLPKSNTIRHCVVLPSNQK